MDLGEAIIVDRLDSVEMRPSSQPVYDREIELGDLFTDPGSGAEHYVVRYPAGLRARPHRHTAGHTIVVLEGRLVVNDQVVGPGAYCHLPGGQPMFHRPAGREPCRFLIMFDGPFDVEPLGDEWS
jgi:quercetin dioxygenase-like cupin family protein